MDFAVCPACSQSVLDDDAENCPFCGASMKSKPGAKPPAKPAASSSTAPSKGAAAPKSKTPAKSAGDDLPFGLNEASAAVAATAVKQPTKGRTLQVTCPMCETVGYVPPSVAGKEIKCANPQCLVPVFTAPEPEPEPVAPPPPKKSGNLVLLALGTAAVVGGGGFAAWFLASQPEGDGVFVKPLDPNTIVKTPTVNDTQVNPPEQVPDSNTGTQTPAETPQPAVKLDAVIASVLQQCQQASLLTDARNRSKALCRRLSAEAYALGGDLRGATQQIDALKNVGAELPFYQVTPWVEVFWQQRLQQVDASAALQNGVAASEKLPNRGRDQLDVATRLATALVVSGQLDQARTLIAAHQAADLDGEASAQFLWLANDPAGRDLNWLHRTRPVIARQAPQAASVTACTSLRGESNAALQFAKGWTDPAVQGECLAAWGEAKTWLQPDTVVDALAAETATLAPAQAALIWARAARVAVARKSPEVANELLRRGAESLAKISPPRPYEIPAVTGLARTRPVLDSSWTLSAAAAAELAAAQIEASGDSASAVAMLDLALQFTRGLGPSVPAITTLVEAANRLGPAGLRNQLRADLDLRTDDQARLAMGEYRRSLTDLETAAQTRFQLQTSVLTRLTQLGLDEAIWKIVARVSSTETLEERENFLATPVSEWLAERFRQRNDETNLKLLTAARTTANLPALVRPTAAVFEEQLAQGKYTDLWTTLTAPGVKSDQREASMLRAVVTQALQASTPNELWTFIGTIKNDVVLREQAIEWGSWMAARRSPQMAAAVWEHYKTLSAATELTSLGRGVAAGIRDVRLTETPQTETTAHDARSDAVVSNP